MNYIFILESNIQNILLLTETVCWKPTFKFLVGFSVAGLDHSKFGFYQFQSFLFIAVIVISIYLKLHFHKFQSKASYWWQFYRFRTRKKTTSKAIEKYRYGLWKTVSKHRKGKTLALMTSELFVCISSFFTDLTCPLHF